MKYYCIGHKPPTFLPSEPYIHVSPNIYPELNLKLYKTKPDLIRQLVNNDFWDDSDIYGYLQY